MILPGTDLEVSQIVLGCEPLGGADWGQLDLDQVMLGVREAWDSGITTFDTSDIYGLGESERNLAKALGPVRKQAVIVTKFGLVPHIPPDGGRAKVTKDASPEQVLRSLEASLQRLDIDCIPLYLLHYPDGKTPLEDTIAVLEQCKAQGKIRHWGVSNFGAPMLDALCLAGSPAVLQSQYSLVDRQIESEILPAALAHKVSVMAYGPLAQGLLTGKYSASSHFGEDDRRHRLPHFSPEAWQGLGRLLGELEAVAQELGRSQAQVAIRWVLAHPAVKMAIVGAKNPEQARHNSAALDFELPQEAYRRLEIASQVDRITA